MGWLRAKQGAEYCGVSLRTFRSWLASGGLPHSRIGGCVVVSTEKLDAWLLAHEVDGDAVGSVVDEVLAEIWN